MIRKVPRLPLMPTLPFRQLEDWNLINKHDGYGGLFQLHTHQGWLSSWVLVCDGQKDAKGILTESEVISWHALANVSRYSCRWVCILTSLLKSILQPSSPVDL
ncbi:PREDICTED: uncharacterized protein LOC101305356 [Fragaria vesca subsp. vesca]